MLKSFSIGHTAKGKVWWQRWMVDGTADKGSTDTIAAALGAVGVVAPSTGDGEIASIRAEYSAMVESRKNDREQETAARAMLDLRIAELEAELETARIEANSADKLCNDAWESNAGYRDKIAALEAGTAPASGDKAAVDLRIKLTQAEGQAAVASAQIAALQTENDTLKADLSALRKQVGADRLERWGVANG